MNPDDKIILLIENERSEQHFGRRLLLAHPVPNTVVDACTQSEAMQRLKNDADSPMPSAIVIEMGSPPDDDLELIRWLREQPHGEHVPVVVVGAGNDLSIYACYAAGGDAFVRTNQPDYRYFEALIESMIR